jgi:hypothetical protein
MWNSVYKVLASLLLKMSFKICHLFLYRVMYICSPHINRYILVCYAKVNL